MTNEMKSHAELLENFLLSKAEYFDKIEFISQSNRIITFEYYDSDANKISYLRCSPTLNGYNISQYDPKMNEGEPVYSVTFEEIREANEI